ncbi:PA14 domain-containing protein [Desulfarculales bacterium]
MGEALQKALPADNESAARLRHIILVIGLGGWLLCLGLAGLCWWEARQADSTYEKVWANAPDPDTPGARVYRMRLDMGQPSRYFYTPLTVSLLEWQQGPLTEAEDYKIKALAGLTLAAPQRLFFRVRGSDGVSIYIQGEPFFEQWRPYPLTFDARFSQEVPSGQLLLEVDYYKANKQSGLSVEIRDEAGRPVDLMALRPEVDVAVWLAKRASRDAWDRRTLYALGMALLLGLLPLAWGLMRNPHWLSNLYASFKHLAPGFWTGFWAVILVQMARLLSSQESNDLLSMLGVPLAGGLTGFLALALAWRLGGSQRLESWRNWYLARERFLFPGAAFLLYAAYVSFAIHSLGGYVPHAFLEAPWDAQQYKDIAENWYWLRRTETGGIAGNYPWHMLLPLLARLWILVGVDLNWAMLLVVWPSALAVFYLLFRLAADLYGVHAARWSLAALACYSCSWYLLIAFPYSLAMALCMGYFLAVRSRRLGWAVVLGYLLGTTYITAVLAAAMPLFLLGPEISRNANPWPDLRYLLLVSAAPVLGLLTFCVNHWIMFNQFLLPITGHEMWGRKAAWPWAAIIDGLLHEPPHYPEAITMVMIIGAMLIFAHPMHAALWALILLTVAAGPGTGDLESVYRQNLMAWPLFVLIGSSPRNRWLKMGWLWMSVYFALKWFLPLWLSKDLV